MKKEDLIKRLSETCAISKVDAKKYTEAIIDIITDTLVNSEDLSLFSFGTFKIIQRKARKGRNPRTGEVINIKASKSPVFKASRSLKDKCNHKK